MSGIALPDLVPLPSIAGVKEFLDQPAQKFLKNETITAMINYAYNLIFYQIDINTSNQIVVVDAIYAIASWRCFGAYGNSISQTLQLQDIGAYRVNLEHYKEVAMLAASLIGIDLEREEQPPLSDALPILKYGGSMLDV